MKAYTGEWLAVLKVTSQRDDICLLVSNARFWEQIRVHMEMKCVPFQILENRRWEASWFISKTEDIISNGLVVNKPTFPTCLAMASVYTECQGHLMCDIWFAGCKAQMGPSRSICTLTAFQREARLLTSQQVLLWWQGLETARAQVDWRTVSGW